MSFTLSQLFGEQWVCVPNEAEAVDDESERVLRQRKTLEQAARSKTGQWGPTHSEDSEDSSLRQQSCRPSPAENKNATTHNWLSSFAVTSAFTTPKNSKAPLNQSQQTDSTKSSASSRQSPQPSSAAALGPGETPSDIRSPTSWKSETSASLERMWNSAQTAFNCREDTTISNSKPILSYVEEVCSPCQPRSLHQELADDNDIHDSPNRSPVEAPLGIAPMEPPEEKKDDRTPTSSIVNLDRQTSIDRPRNADNQSTSSSDTPAERRRQRHRQRQLRASSQTPLSELPEAVEVTTDRKVHCNGAKINADTNTKGKSSSIENGDSSSSPANIPLESLTVTKDVARELERSISELTMKSSYGEATAKLAENRRMAYYAVGRHHRNSGRGGNRRCYFTGKLILGGAPFYAGSVQQGLRTLVVFCLPSAIGLPKGVDVKRETSFYSLGASARLDENNSNSRRGTATPATRGDMSSSHSSIGINMQPNQNQLRRPSLLSRKRSATSRLSSVDDMSLSIEEEMDPNWGLDRDFLLSVLPEPTQSLLDEMATRYPAQFETLPVQVRSPHCWRLYVKFCFFSGLPIAEGEMHYKVRDDIAEQYGEEIILSHEVMEAVNGESAEILRLPNLKTFRYLRKHYSQQSGKLPEHVFQRISWEMVRPEI